MTDKELLDLSGKNPREPFTGICTDLKTKEPRLYCETVTLAQAKYLGKTLLEIRIYKHTPKNKLAHWDLAFDAREEENEEIDPDFDFNRDEV